MTSNKRTAPRRIPDAYLFSGGGAVVYLQCASEKAKKLLHNYTPDPKGCIRFAGKQLEPDGSLEASLSLLDTGGANVMTLA